MSNDNATKLARGAMHALTAQPEPLTTHTKSPSTSSPSVEGDWLRFVAKTKEMEAFRRAIIEFEASMGGPNPRWLTLLGPSGCGKTHCAKAIWRRIQDRKLPWNPPFVSHLPHLVYWPKFVDKLRSGEGYDQARDMQRWPYLVLDDVGAERDKTGFAIDTLNTLLGCRNGRWTVITSNLSAADWTRAEPRIASRMLRDGSMLLQATFGDYAIGSG